MKIVGQRLKLLRESVKLSQAKIATLIGTQQTSINRYETNQYSPPLKVIEYVAAVLHREPDRLYTCGAEI